MRVQIPRKIEKSSSCYSVDARFTDGFRHLMAAGGWLPEFSKAR